MSEVESKLDFIKHLGPDLSIKILTHLDDLCDLFRVSAVSQFWYRFVIENGLCKKLCFKMFPQISDVVHSIEVENIIEPISDMLGICTDWERLKRNHKVYTALDFDLSPCVNNCISKAIVASSTNNYPEESILNTLEPGERTENRASYWLSGGNRNSGVPAYLLYKLRSQTSFITEIHVQPFQGWIPYIFETVIAHGMAATYMREHETHFVWTYTSPSYLMLQENWLQEFKLPEPSLCIGGVLLVELGGRVQKRGLFYYTGIIIKKSFTLAVINLEHNKMGCNALDGTLLCSGSAAVEESKSIRNQMPHFSIDNLEKNVCTFELDFVYRSHPKFMLGQTSL